MRIYLDNCCYTRTFDDQKQFKIRQETESIIKIQEKIISKDIELATSFILHYENNQKIDEDHKNKIDNFYRIYRTIYIGIEFTDKLRNIVKEIMSTGIKVKDSYNIACAILANCNYFITVDKRLTKYESDKIKVINPIDFLKILEVSCSDR
ncbi:MAG: hypothetical protein IJ728_03640 [Selenomonadaceae bacterium]|nr:hypothetical protein [Selenomonadaceae bacterium]